MNASVGVSSLHPAACVLVSSINHDISHVLYTVVKDRAVMKDVITKLVNAVQCCSALGSYGTVSAVTAVNAALALGLLSELSVQFADSYGLLSVGS